MLPEILNIRKSLNKAYLKVKPVRSDIERFKSNISELISHSNSSETEEHHKNIIAGFLKNTYYEPDHYINTKGRTDLVIHNGKDSKSTVGVIIETKRPGNKSEMPSEDNINTKAVHELILYYLRERITGKNLEIKHLIATDLNEWFIFNAQEFEKLFASNKKLIADFQQFEEGSLSGTKTDFFYNEIARPFIESLEKPIQLTHFSIGDFKEIISNSDKKDDNKLIGLYKIFSPEHLLKLPFSNDSNTLDRKFYNELLHIIGLEETKEGSKKLIGRKAEKTRNADSLLENTINILKYEDSLNQLSKPSDYGDTKEDQLYTVALELCITWINRVLFLKLLEGQLIRYHNGDEKFKFLHPGLIHDYDALNKLFFQVLAVKEKDRNEKVKQIFGNIPYLNSSLFEATDLEHKTIRISNLEDHATIPVISGTVLKDASGNKVKGEEQTLHYLLKFLDSYDFSSEGKEDISEENKTLINASVLGLIFEKINGYKDGSFFTPGFITMYMCRETIRSAVVQKFNEFLGTHPQPLSRGEFAPSDGSSENGDSSNSSNIDNSQTPYTNKPETSITPLLRGAGGVSSRRTIIPYNPKLKEYARTLRNNSTRAEIAMWMQLKGKFEGKYDFHRQKPLDNYIADFFCHELKLVIEIDGETHNWEETQKKDYEKECRFNEIGLNVLRFTDADVHNNLDYPVNSILMYIEGFEKGDLSAFNTEDTPLNPLSRGDFFTNDDAILNQMSSDPNSGKLSGSTPLSKGDFFTNEDAILNQMSSDPNSGKLPGSTPLLRGVGGVSEREETFSSINDIYNSISEKGPITKQEANAIINSLKICDPAVGSGHFLVSALNEIIAIKSELKILTDRKGKILRDYHVEVVNDELVITDEDGEFFEYHHKNPESQRIQETLFHEKQTIIENCLFGVDINQNSVKICRLRLWIELLKNAYYIDTATPLSRGAGGVSFESSVGVLETLPNIDINIKCGNSLISRYALDADIKKALQKSRWSIESYRAAVMTYRNAENKDQKAEMRRLIDQIKSDFESEVASNDKRILKLNKLKGELTTLTTQTSLFSLPPKEKAEWDKKVSKVTSEISGIEKELEEIKNNKIYEHAFEWRFEFPEVLNDEGDFVGFDVVIGNPPYYIITKNNTEFLELSHFLNNFQTIKNASSKNIFNLFIELGITISNHYSFHSMIVPEGLFETRSYADTISLFANSGSVLNITRIEGMVFDEANTGNVIFIFSKNKKGEKSQEKIFNKNQDLIDFSNVPDPIISKIDNLKNPKLSEICQLFKGMVISNRKNFIFETRAENLPNKFLLGNCISKWNINKIFFSDYTQLNIIGGTKLKAKYDVSPRILIRRTGDFLCCAYLTEPALTESTLYSCWSINNDIHNLFILGVLHSKLANYYIKSKLVTNPQAFPQILMTDLQSLPIAKPTKEMHDSIMNLVESRLSKNENHVDIENQIDHLVFKLYGLTEEEIGIINTKIL